MYEYQARVVDVLDGSTVEMVVDLGFGIFKVFRFRVFGVIAPDRSGVERLRGELATERLRALLADTYDGTVLVLTVKGECDGAYFARILVQTNGGDVVDVGERLIAEGFAAPCVV